jgi:hypothetical protein
MPNVQDNNRFVLDAVEDQIGERICHEATDLRFIGWRSLVRKVSEPFDQLLYAPAYSPRSRRILKGGCGRQLLPGRELRAGCSE